MFPMRLDFALRSTRTWCLKKHSLEGRYLLPLRMAGVIIRTAEKLKDLCKDEEGGMSQA